MSRPIPALLEALRFARRQVEPESTRVEGRTLALYRAACGVAASEVAERLDVSRQRISGVDATWATPEMAARYRAAVDMIRAEGRAE